MKEADVIYVTQLAEILGMTQAAVYARINRHENAGAEESLPPGFRVGRRRAWRRATVQKWLESKDAKGRRL